MPRVLKTWLTWVAVVGLMTVAIGGATWSAFFAGEREAPARRSYQVTVPLETYAATFCYNVRPMMVEQTRSINYGGERYNVWPTLAEAKQHFADTLARLRTIRPPRGLEGFHRAARAAVWSELRLLEQQEDDGSPVEIAQPIGAGLPYTYDLNDELLKLPDDLEDLMNRHGCRYQPLVE